MLTLCLLLISSTGRICQQQSGVPMWELLNWCFHDAAVLGISVSCPYTCLAVDPTVRNRHTTHLFSATDLP